MSAVSDVLSLVDSGTTAAVAAETLVASLTPVVAAAHALTTGTLPVRIVMPTDGKGRHVMMPSGYKGPWHNVVGLAPPSLDCGLHMWIPLRGQAVDGGLNYEGRYVFHIGTSWIYDLWTGVWVASAFNQRSTTPRYSLCVPTGEASGASSVAVWVHLPRLILDALSMLPATHPYARPAECSERVAWTLALPSEYARLLYLHERQHGPQSAPFHAHQLLWVRRGRPSYRDCQPFAARVDGRLGTNTT